MTPTLSILIPCFDYDCSGLVADLQRKGDEEGISLEIIVGDDTLTRLGRARNCNRLAEQASGEWLLIVDCDAAMPPAFSLRKYVEAGRQAPVVCGGLYHPDVNPCPEATLRFKYERKADLRRAARFRQEHPYAQLSTFSLLVRRETFLAIRFDEACVEYGYEDTLFGAELVRRGIPIMHIDNPLIHTGLEPNAIFLAKTETAMRTLHRLEQKLRGHSHLLSAVDRLQRLHLCGLIRCCWRLFRKPMRANLLGKHPSLFFFSVYKLGFFLCLR